MDKTCTRSIIGLIWPLWSNCLLIRVAFIVFISAVYRWAVSWAKIAWTGAAIMNARAFCWKGKPWNARMTYPFPLPFWKVIEKPWTREICMSCPFTCCSLDGTDGTWMRRMISLGMFWEVCAMHACVFNNIGGVEQCMENQTRTVLSSDRSREPRSARTNLCTTCICILRPLSYI